MWAPNHRSNSFCFGAHLQRRQTQDGGRNCSNSIVDGQGRRRSAQNFWYFHLGPSVYQKAISTATPDSAMMPYACESGGPVAKRRGSQGPKPRQTRLSLSASFMPNSQHDAQTLHLPSQTVLRILRGRFRTWMLAYKFPSLSPAQVVDPHAFGKTQTLNQRRSPDPCIMSTIAENHPSTLQKGSGDVTPF